MTTRSATSPDTITVAERARTALTMRKAGHTYDEIAEACGYAGRSSAHYVVTRHLAAVREEVTETAAEMFQLDIARTEDLYLSLAAGISAGDPQAIGAALRILERRAKMLGHDDFEKRMASVAEKYRAVTEEQAIQLATALAGSLSAQPNLSPEDRARIALDFASRLEMITEPSSGPNVVAAVVV